MYLYSASQDMHEDWVNCVAFSADSATLCTASSDGTACVFNLQYSAGAHADADADSPGEY